MSLKPRQFKECAVCTKPFQVFQSTQKVCSMGCAVKHKQVTEIRRDAKARREATKQQERSAWVDKAQKAFNAYIRARDRYRVCISCGIECGKMNAGHYRTTKAAPQLRFNTYNCHKQCEQCNTYKSANITEYRPNLVIKIGEDRVIALESDQRLASHNIEYLKRVTRIFNKRAKLYRSFPSSIA